jgi:hypothetical protein
MGFLANACTATNLDLTCHCRWLDWQYGIVLVLMLLLIKQSRDLNSDTFKSMEWSWFIISTLLLDLNWIWSARMHPRNHKAGDRFSDTGWVAKSVEGLSEDSSVVFVVNFWIRYCYRGYFF